MITHSESIFLWKIINVHRKLELLLMDNLWSYGLVNAVILNAYSLITMNMNNLLIKHLESNMSAPVRIHIRAWLFL